MTHEPMPKDFPSTSPIIAQSMKVGQGRRSLRGGMTLLSSLALLGVGGCSTSKPDLPINDVCAQMLKGDFIFKPVGNTPMGSLEPGVPVDEGALIIDDDDLSDDYNGWKSNPEYGWKQALAAYDTWAAENADIIAIANALDAETEQTIEQQNAVISVTAAYLEIVTTHCARSDRYVYSVGMPVAPPTFVDCKDKYNASGDGIIGFVDLTETVMETPVSMMPGSTDDTARRTSTYFSLTEQDRVMAQCSRPETVFQLDDAGEVRLDESGEILVNDNPEAQLPNTQALNFWAPLTTSVTTIPGSSPVRDGHTFSGVTVPLTVAPYLGAYDASEWDGIGFWARLVDAEQAIPIDRVSPAGQEPLSGREIPSDAQAQTGKNSLALIVQTVDTAALGEDGNIEVTINDQCQASPPNEAPVPGTEAEPCFADQAAFDAFPTPVQQELDDDGNVLREFKYAVNGPSGFPLPVPFPFCIDYSPADAPTQGEVPFRDQCWDGFRNVRDISKEWKFYFFPFEEMRQSGSGRIAESLRLDRVKSINVFASVFQPVNVLIDEISFYKAR